VSAGEVRFVLAKRIGEVVIGQSVPPAVILESLSPQPSTINLQPSTPNLQPEGPPHVCQ